MSEPNVIRVGILRGGQFDKTLEIWQRVYSVEGIAPALVAMMNGRDDTTIKIIELKEK